MAASARPRVIALDIFRDNLHLSALRFHNDEEKLAALLNEPKNSASLTDLLDRLPESMTDQSRTGTYGSWYSYYICGFSGRITLPAGLGAIPGVRQLMSQLNHLDFHSTAPRCNGASAP